MGLHDYGHVNAPQRSYVITVNKMAVDIQRETVTVDF